MRCFPVLTIVVTAGLSLGGCAAVQTAISKADLDVQSKMTDTIFLDPIGPGQKTVLIQSRNSSDQPGFDIETDLTSAIAAKGYTIVEDPKRAYYWLQVNVLQVGKIDPSAAERWYAAGFGSALGTAAAGATIGALASSTYTGAGIGGLVGGAIAVVADAAVKDITYSIITDVQVSERSKVTVHERTNQMLKQGSRGTRETYAKETSDQKRYQTRVMSTANKVNLSLEEALPPLRAGIVRSIAGIF
jgi:hypothetical protein